MRKINRIFILPVVLLIIGVVLFMQQRNMTEGMVALPASYAGSLLEERSAEQVVASGLVEPVSKELRLGFDMSGVIMKVAVKEGDMVQAGQVLAHLRQSEELARMEEARAAMLNAKADLVMHETGSRPEERNLSVAKLQRAQVWLDQVHRETERRSIMVQTRSIGREELERSQRDLRVARHEHDMAVNENILVNDLYRGEEVEMARQRLLRAEAQLSVAEAMLDKTFLRAPVGGKVLRIFSDPGEAYSILAPSAVISMGDTAVMNVRAEVDERDVGRVQLGQKAFVAAESFSGERFNGTVSRMELSMTPKRVRGGDPSEPVDRSVLEVLITLDAPGRLISGQRVDVFISGAQGTLPENPAGATTQASPAATPEKAAE